MLSHLSWKLTVLFSIICWSCMNVLQSMTIGSFIYDEILIQNEPSGLSSFRSSNNNNPMKSQSQWSQGDEPFIDAVFTYVNGSDPVFIESIRAFGGIDVARVRDMGQLKYAMRSVFMHAPYVRNFIVVVSDKERQVPDWLDASHPRIRIVEHKEIWDNVTNLPSFNSQCIEWSLMNIPGLSDKFLYLNDDFAIWQGLKLSTILPNDDNYLVWEAWEAPASEKQAGDTYGKSLAYMTKRFDEKYGIKKKRRTASHVPLLLDKKLLQEIKQEFKEEIDTMFAKKPFRTAHGVQFQFTYQQYIRHHKPYYRASDSDDHVHFASFGNSLVRNNMTFNKLEDNPRQFIVLQDHFNGNPRGVVRNEIWYFYEYNFRKKAPWEKKWNRAKRDRKSVV